MWLYIALGGPMCTASSQSSTEEGSNQSPLISSVLCSRPPKGAVVRRAVVHIGQRAAYFLVGIILATPCGKHRNKGCQTLLVSRSCGGCKPSRKSAHRRLTIPSRFRHNPEMVARPVEVSPSRCVYSSSHAKWSRQRCVRGWNKAARLMFSGSGASILLYLWLLQPEHANARFSDIVSPPLTRGIMCSTANDSVENANGLRQYSQHRCARRSISYRKCREMRSDNGWRLQPKLLHYLSDGNLAQGG